MKTWFITILSFICLYSSFTVRAPTGGVIVHKYNIRHLYLLTITLLNVIVLVHAKWGHLKCKWCFSLVVNFPSRWKCVVLQVKTTSGWVKWNLSTIVKKSRWGALRNVKCMSVAFWFSQVSVLSSAQRSAQFKMFMCLFFFFFKVSSGVKLVERPSLEKQNKVDL